MRYSDRNYFGESEFNQYGQLIKETCKGIVISKRRDEADEPGGLIYEAKRIGISDFWCFLRALEGMCHNGWAIEIDDSHYKIL